MAEKKKAEEKAEKKKKPKAEEAPKVEKEAKKPKAAEAKAEKPAETEKKEENISKSLVDQVREGMVKDKPLPSMQAIPQKSEFVAVVHVFASKNNTIVTATDISGAETLARASGGMLTKSGREERTPFIGGQLAKKVAGTLMEKGVTKVDVLLRGRGGHRGQKTPGRAASSVIKILARTGLRIRRIEDVTPIPHGGSTAPGGKRGRRV